MSPGTPSNGTGDGPRDDPGADPHADQPIETAGAPATVADAAVVFLHGRGATASGMLALADELRYRGATFVAPQAARSRWYPDSTYAPIERNQPWVDSALRRVSAALELAAAADVPPERTILVGFSQGASIAAEFVGRHPRRYGGLAVLSGGLLGGDRGDRFDGSIEETPVYAGYGSDDSYVSPDTVAATVEAFEAIGGAVRSERIEGLEHAIDDAELRVIDRYLDRLP